MASRFLHVVATLGIVSYVLVAIATVLVGWLFLCWSSIEIAIPLWFGLFWVWSINYKRTRKIE